ncbi:MAG: hypothetical protein WC213_07355, partial [Arenimonas sp.]
MRSPWVFGHSGSSITQALATLARGAGLQRAQPLQSLGLGFNDMRGQSEACGEDHAEPFGI